MIINTISNYNDFLQIENEYADLWTNSVDKNIFNSPVFVKSYFKNFSKNNKIYFLCLYNNNKLIGVAPLKIVKKSFFIFKWNELRFATEGDYRGFIVRKKSCCSDANEEQIIKHLLNEIENLKCDRICLDYISQHSSLFKYLSKNDYYNSKVLYHIQVPFINIDLSDSHEEIPIIFPKKMRKYRNKLIKDNDYNLIVKNKMDDSDLDEMSSLHIKEMKYLISRGNDSRHSLYEDLDRKNYVYDTQKLYDNVFHFMLRRKSDNKLICYRNTYFCNNTLHSWNTAYDPEFESYRVNNTFFYEIFKYIYENKICNKFNFGSGGYAWKFSFTDDFDVLYKLDFFNKKAKFIEKLINLKKVL